MANKPEDEDVMPRESEVICAYRRLEVQASHMAALAREQDWDALIGEQEKYAGAAEGVADMEKGVTLDERENTTKYTILEHILGHDLEVRSRLIERREELSQMMAVSRRESALERAYGARGPVRAGEPPGSEKKHS